MTLHQIFCLEGKRKFGGNRLPQLKLKRRRGRRKRKRRRRRRKEKNLGSHLLSIPSVAWYVCKKFRVEGPWMLRCMCVHMHVWKYVCHCAYMDIRGCLGRHYMT